MAKLVNPCTHGQSNETFNNLTVRGIFTTDAIIGSGLNAATFGVGAAGTTTITDANVVAVDSQVVIFPNNAAAGLLLRTKTCWVSNITDGSFIFNVSATGAGAPDGTESMAYFVSNHTAIGT